MTAEKIVSNVRAEAFEPLEQRLGRNYQLSINTRSFSDENK